MTKSLKIIIGIAVGLVLAGAVLAFVALAAAGFDTGKLGAGKFETKEYTVEDTFDGVTVSVKTADVTFLPSEDGTVRVECYEGEKHPHTVGVVDGKLTIFGADQRKWYEMITIFSKSPKIRVYLPAGEYTSLSLETDTGDVMIPETVVFGTVKIETDTGDVELYGGSPAQVEIETDTGDVTYAKSNPGAVKINADTGTVRIADLAAGDISVENDTGKVKMTDVSCAALSIETDTGDVILKNVVGTGDAKIVTDTGDVEFDRCDAANYEIKTDTGDVEGTLRSGKLYTASSHTGKINLPEHDTAGGAFKVSTHTGDVRITIAE